MNCLINCRPTPTARWFDNVEQTVDALFGYTPRWAQQAPVIDTHEEDDQYILEAELPGLTEKDIQVDINDNLLTIASIAYSEEEDKEASQDTSASKDDDPRRRTARERRLSAFKQSFAIPRNTARDKIEAHLSNGLLRITLPKVEAAKPVSITIKST